MSNESDELVIAANGQVFVADVGTTLPTSVSASLNARFVDLGFVTEDGATFSDGKTVQEFMAWQSLYAVRRQVTARNTTVSFTLEQWNSDTVRLAFGGGTVTEPTNNLFKYVPPVAEELDERALILDAQDGDKSYRWVFPRGMVTEGVEVPMKRTDLAVLPITYSVVAEDGADPWIFYTDDQSFTLAS